MQWNLVVDSSSDMLSTDFENQNVELTIVPLKIQIGEKEYMDDDAIDTDAMLFDMKREKRASSSACPSTGDFYEAFLKADQTICILLTSGLSGTFNSASVARDMVLEEFPDRKIHLIDTKATAGVLELVARKAAAMIDEGLSYEEITQALDDYTKSVAIVFTLESYDNLVKNGRMSHFAGAIASHLGIRAVSINNPQGEIEVVKKCRGEEKALQTMMKIMVGRKSLIDIPILISHCKNEEGAKKFKALLKEKCSAKNITIRPCKALTSFYTMQGGILVSY